MFNIQLFVYKGLPSSESDLLVLHFLAKKRPSSPLFFKCSPLFQYYAIDEILYKPKMKWTVIDNLDIYAKKVT